MKPKTYHCERCDHWTVSRTAQPPLRCGKCKSPYWRTPRKAAANAGKD